MWTHMAEGPCPAIGKTCNKPNHVCCHAVKLTYMTSWNCTQTRHRVAPIDIPVTDTLWYMCISQHHWWNRSNTKKYKNIVAHVCVWIWLTVLGQFINVGSKHVQSMLFLLLLSYHIFMYCAMARKEKLPISTPVDLWRFTAALVDIKVLEWTYIKSSYTFTHTWGKEKTS